MTVFWGPYGDMWEPQGGEHKEWRDLQPGDLIVSSRKVWRVHEVRQVPVVDWEDRDRDAYRERNRPGVAEEFWALRPLNLIGSWASGGRRESYRIRPYEGYGRKVYVLHPHYPVCHECGEPWPCPELDIKAAIDKQAAELARLESIMPGCCWCCGEPVTSRHKSIVFDGENLLLPGGPPVVFHLRERSKGGVSCLSAAIGYEKRWVPAAAGRRWRLSCPGNVTLHVDGRECSELAGCPGDVGHLGNYVSHRFTGTREGEVVPVPGSGADKCRRCLDAVAAGFYAREQAEYLARKAAEGTP